MKKLLAALTALIMILACTASLAESGGILTVEEAGALYDEYLDRILSAEDGTDYQVGTVEYGALDPLDVNPKEYIEGLQRAKLAAADIDEAPDGEFVFLIIPDQVQFDFFQGEAEKNYIRVTLFGDTEKSVLAQAVQKLFGDTGIRIIGTRHGEKLYETLMTREERLRSEDMGNYFRVAADNRDLNYDKYFTKGKVATQADESYTSHNTKLLSVEETVQKILTTDYVKEELEGIRHN